MRKFKKIVVLDTVIFYEEHERILKSLVDNPIIDRIPLEYDQELKDWILPDGYEYNSNANIVFWPTSLPENIYNLSPEIESRLVPAYDILTNEHSLDEHSFNLLKRIKNADCIITCWTSIPNSLFQFIQPTSILTWTHEYEHRINIELAKEKGIYTGCVNDYGTTSVAELSYNMMIELIQRNFRKEEKAVSKSDYTINVLSILFDTFRQMSLNEKDTRKGKFSHQFHKIGRAKKYFNTISDENVHDAIPNRIIEGKTVGFIGSPHEFHESVNVLKNGFGTHVLEYYGETFIDANFYKVLFDSDIVFYNGQLLPYNVVELINNFNSTRSFDISNYPSFNFNFNQKSIGIIGGHGRIGKKIEKIATTLNWDVTLISKEDNLKNILNNFDIITLNVTPHKNSEILGKVQLDSLKPNCIFINTSDGNVVNQKALIEKAQKNEILIGLDVYQGLPTSKQLNLDDKKNGKLNQRLSNHIFTYRAGWFTYESIRIKTYKLLGLMHFSLNKKLK